MNSPSTLLRAMAVLGLPLLAPSLSAAPPPPITAADKEALQADAASRAAALPAKAAEAKAGLEKDVADGAALSQKAATFLAENNIPPVPTDAVPPPSQPLEAPTGPEMAVINCDGGMYFDSEAGVLVYLKNITVKHPEFNLSGANELKVFFEKKPETADDKKKQDDKETDHATPPTDKPAKGDSALGSNLGDKFGQVQRVIATGAVLLEQTKTQDGKPPIKASGAIVTFNPNTNIAVISGGFPWVLQGTSYVRAKEANMTFRIDMNTNSAVSEAGPLEMGGHVEQKGEKKDKSKKDKAADEKQKPKKSTP